MNKMNKQIFFSTIIFILIIEVIVLYFSYESRYDQLVNLKRTLKGDIEYTTDKKYEDIHPEILDKNHIEFLMSNYLYNVLKLSVLIAILTALGTTLVFHLYVGKHILRLKRLNKMNKGLNIAKWGDRFDIPNNEVGDLILEREGLIMRLNKEKL